VIRDRTERHVIKERLIWPAAFSPLQADDFTRGHLVRVPQGSLRFYVKRISRLDKSRPTTS
jgi:hypothetical protein